MTRRQESGREGRRLWKFTFTPLLHDNLGSNRIHNRSRETDRYLAYENLLLRRSDLGRQQSESLSRAEQSRLREGSSALEHTLANPEFERIRCLAGL